MHQPVAHLALTEYHLVRDAIDTFGLWWEEDEPPSRISPALMMRGWTIEAVAGLTPLLGVAVRRDGTKRILLPIDAPLSMQAATLAHVLAHDLLDHPFETDWLLTPTMRGLIDNRDVHPAHDRAAVAAASVMLIPDRFADAGLSVAEISSWCGVPRFVAERRLHGMIILDEEPCGIVHIHRKCPRTFARWAKEPTSILRSTGAD